MNKANNPIITYYEQTRWDCRHLWRSDKTGAMPLGYYDTHTRGHAQSLRRMTSHLATLAQISPTDRVLDSPTITNAQAADLQTGCQGWQMPRLLSAAEYRELLAEHGFDKVQVVDPLPQRRPLTAPAGPPGPPPRPTAPIFERLGVLGPVPANNLRATAALIRTFDNGTWRYKVILAERQQ